MTSHPCRRIQSLAVPSPLHLFFQLLLSSTYLTVPWLYATEINPLRIRAKGTALANIVNWSINFLGRYGNSYHGGQHWLGHLCVLRCRQLCFHSIHVSPPIITRGIT